MVKHWRIGLFGTIVSLLAIYFIMRQVNIAEFAKAWEAARFIYVLPCVLFLLAGLVTRAFRWQVLLSGSLPLGRAFSIMNVAYLVNGVLPLRIGELGRIYLALNAEPPVPIFKTASTIIVERLLDLLAVVVMTLLALTSIASLPDELRKAALLAAPSAIFGFLVLVFFARKRVLAQRILAFFSERWAFLRQIQLARWLDQFLDGLAPLAHPQALLQAVFWTALSWGFSIIAGYILMFTFFEQASWGATMLYIAAAAFAIAVPAMPANIGPYEWSIYLALGAAGYGDARATVLAFALMVHGVNVLVHAATGVIGFIHEGVSLERLSQGVGSLRREQSAKF